MDFDCKNYMEMYNEFRKNYPFNKYIISLINYENLNKYIINKSIFEELYFNITCFTVQFYLKSLVKFINSNIKINYLYVNKKLLESLKLNYKCINNIYLNNLSLNGIDLTNNNIFKSTIYIKTLNMCDVTFNGNFKNIIKNISKTCPNIKELNIITDDNLNYNNLKYLKYIKNLKVITLFFNNLNYINIVFETLDYLLSKNLILQKIILNGDIYTEKNNYTTYEKKRLFNNIEVNLDECKKIPEYSKLKKYVKDIIFLFENSVYIENLLVKNI